MGWWLGIASLYASTGGSCPCCGAPGCAVGFSGAGLIGAAFALLMRRKAGSALSKSNPEAASTCRPDHIVSEAP